MITRPVLDCVSSLVVAPLTEGVSATGVTVIVALTVLPPAPPTTLEVEAWTVKLPLAVLFRLGVNFSPALP